MNKKTLSLAMKAITSIMYLVVSLLMSFGESYRYYHSSYSYWTGSSSYTFRYSIIEVTENINGVLLVFSIIFLCIATLIGITSIWINKIQFITIPQPIILMIISIISLAILDNSRYSVLALYGWIIFFTILLIMLCVVTVIISTPSKTQNLGDVKMNEQNGYIDMTKHILLLLFTCGIWHYIWIYRTTKTLNNTPDEEYYDPTSKLLLCMFVPFYYIYWVAKHAHRLDKYANENGVQSDTYSLCLIMSIFVPVVSYIIMQDKINAVAKKLCGYEDQIHQYETNAAGDSFQHYNNYYPQNNTQQSVNRPANNATELDRIELLKQYKELLDDGIISKEDFDAKKKELLIL